MCRARLNALRLHGAEVAALLGPIRLAEMAAEACSTRRLFTSGRRDDLFDSPESDPGRSSVHSKMKSLMRDFVYLWWPAFI